MYSKRIRNWEAMKKEVEDLRDKAEETMEMFSERGDVENTEFWCGIQIAYQYIIVHFLEE